MEQEIIHLKAQVELLTSQVSSMLTHSKTRESTREPKPADVSRYAGDPNEWSNFWLQVDHFFELQNNTYTSDKMKISYLITRIEGPVLSYVNGLAQNDLPEEKKRMFEDFKTFKGVLAEMFFDRNSIRNASHKFFKLEQRKSIPEHIREFELLAAKANLVPEAHFNTFFYSLRDSVRARVETVAEEAQRPRLLTDYGQLKEFLLGLDARGIRREVLDPEPILWHRNFPTEALQVLTLLQA